MMTVTLFFTASPVLLALLAAILKTQWFVIWLDRLVLMGRPRKLSEDERATINKYFEQQEIRINSVGNYHPLIVPKHATTDSDLFSRIDKTLADILSNEQTVTMKRTDDPHAFVLLDAGENFPRSLYLEDEEQQPLSVYCIDHYSQLRAMPKTIKDRVLVLGANNLTLIPNSSIKFWQRSTIILHRRINSSQTHGGKVHGFGGGYMAYKYEEMDKKTRRDDCKNLHYTAMRELHEESGLLSTDHVKGFYPVIEERHKKSARAGEEQGDFGHFTFFFVTRVLDESTLSYKGDPNEGEAVKYRLGRRSIDRAIFEGKIGEGDAVHPQLRAMLALWLLSKCPGLPFYQRWYLANSGQRKKVLSKLSSS